MPNTTKILMKKKPKFKVGDLVRVSKYKNIFPWRYFQNWPEVFIVSKIKTTVPWTYVISDLNGEPITESFYEKELQKTSQEKFRIEKVLKRKGEKLYIRWKGYNNSFNGCINKKDLIWKWVNTFLSGLEVLEEILTLKLIFQIVQQKQIKNISYVDTSSFALLNKFSQSKNWSW